MFVLSIYENDHNVRVGSANGKCTELVLQRLEVWEGGTAVAQLVEALRYKSEGRGFDSRWCHWNFSLT